MSTSCHRCGHLLYCTFESGWSIRCKRSKEAVVTVDLKIYCQPCAPHGVKQSIISHDPPIVEYSEHCSLTCNGDCAAVSYYDAITKNQQPLPLPANIRDHAYDRRPGMGGNIRHRLLLFRHGESTSNRQLTSRNRHPDPRRHSPTLTSIGHVQAINIAKMFRGDEIDSIEVSPMHRAIQTAMPSIHRVQEVDGAKQVRVRMELREHYSQGKPPYTETVRGIIAPEIPETWQRCPETDQELHKRVASLLAGWSAVSGERKTTLVFSHSLLISAILKQAMGAPVSQNHVHLSNGSLSVVDVMEDGGFHIHMVNSTSHLDGFCTGHHSPYTI